MCPRAWSGATVGLPVCEPITLSRSLRKLIFVGGRCPEHQSSRSLPKITGEECWDLHLALGLGLLGHHLPPWQSAVRRQGAA